MSRLKWNDEMISVQDLPKLRQVYKWDFPKIPKGKAWVIKGVDIKKRNSIKQKLLQYRKKGKYMNFVLRSITESNKTITVVILRRSDLFVLGKSIKLVEK